MSVPYYSPGEKPEHANVLVLKRVKEASTRAATLYLVRLLCCKREREMSHADICKRQTWYRTQGKLTTCIVCAQQRNSMKGAAASRRKAAKRRARERSLKPSEVPSLGFHAPEWPVPELVKESLK